MRFLPFALGGLLLAAARPAYAQTAEPAPAAPRYYVGLAAYSSYYQPLGRAYGNTTVVPVQLVGGYQLRPRLAVQVGLAYSGNTIHYAGAGYYYPTPTTAGSHYAFDHTSTTRVLSASVLARYTLTANPAHRLQFDALGGLSLEQGWAHSRGTQTDSLGGSLRTSSFGTRQTGTVLLLTAGLGTRVRLGRRVELFYDLTFNRALTGEAPRPAPLGLTGSAALGLRYRFGR